MNIRSQRLMSRHVLFTIRITMNGADMKESHGTTVRNMSIFRILPKTPTCKERESTKETKKSRQS